MTFRAHHVLDIPDDDIAFDLVDDAMAALGDASGMRFFFDNTESPDGVIDNNVFLDEEGRAKITLVEDPETPVRYLIIEAHDEQSFRRVAGAVPSVLPVRTTASLRDRARDEMSDDPGHLVRLAVGSGTEADDETLAILNRGMQSGDRNVRIAAIEGASLTQWHEAEALLIDAQANDPDPELREWAGTALAALRAARSS